MTIDFQLIFPLSRFEDAFKFSTEFILTSIVTVLSTLYKIWFIRRELGKLFFLNAGTSFSPPRGENSRDLNTANTLKNTKRRSKASFSQFHSLILSFPPSHPFQILFLYSFRSLIYSFLPNLPLPDRRFPLYLSTPRNVSSIQLFPYKI